MYGYNYSMGHDMWWHPLISLIWVLVVLYIAITVLRNWRCRPHHPHHRAAALEVLRERYAKGEISTAEYEERKKALTAE